MCAEITLCNRSLICANRTCVSVTDYLGKKLENYVATLSVPVKVMRTGTRSGLIRARLIGAKAATGQVLTFLGNCDLNRDSNGIN